MRQRSLLLLLTAVPLVAAGLLVWSGRQITLGSYSTSLEGRSPEQLANIRRAATAVDRQKLLPGQEMSVLACLGETEASGWKSAPVLRGGQVEEEDAGGICQLSSTLYNAVLLSGMEVTERHAHSQRVLSVPEGLDAAVARGVADLRFRNDRGSPVIVRASAAGQRLKLRIMGSPPRPARVALNTERRVSGSRLLVTVWRETPDGRVVVSRDSYRLPRL